MVGQSLTSEQDNKRTSGRNDEKLVARYTQRTQNVRKMEIERIPRRTLCWEVG